MNSTDKIKALPDGGIIKTPVRYHPQGLYGRGSLRDADGLYLLSDDSTDEQSDDWHTARNEHIAKCINDHARLVSELDRKTRALERTRGAIRSVLPHFESHQVYDKGSEAILQEALND